MDNFETGKYRHLPFAQELPYEFMQGYIGNLKDCSKALQDVDIVFDLGMPVVPDTNSYELKDFGEYLKIADGHWSKISFNDLSGARVIKAPTVFFSFFFFFLFFSFSFSFFFLFLLKSIDLYDAALETRVKKVIFLSSFHVYGNVRISSESLTVSLNTLKVAKSSVSTRGNCFINRKQAESV
jgi:hypothetical protein